MTHFEKLSFQIGGSKKGAASVGEGTGNESGARTEMCENYSGGIDATATSPFVCVCVCVCESERETSYF